MKKGLTVILIVVGVVGVLWVAKAWTTFTPKRVDPKFAKFNSDCDALILGIQQYREFVGSYPTGNNIQITKALSGQTEKKVMILAVRRTDMNDKGEMLDPWGTPLMFYFAHNEVLIRSAGPNRAWDDDSRESDDLYRNVGKEH